MNGWIIFLIVWLVLGFVSLWIRNQSTRPDLVESMESQDKHPIVVAVFFIVAGPIIFISAVLIVISRSVKSKKK